MNRALGFFYVLMAGLGFGFLGIFGRLAFQSGMSVGELLTWRFSLAALILWVGLLIFQPRLIRLSLKQILISCALGIGGYAVFSTLYFKSIEGISVPLAALLLFTFPIFVNLGAHFILKHRMTKLQSLSLLLTCLGLGILLWGPMVVHSKKAVFFGLGAAFVYSIYVLVSGQVQQKVAPLSSSLYVITSTALALFLFHQPSLSKIPNMSTVQMTCILGLAIFSTIGPLTFFLAGLQRLPSSQASIIVTVEPVVATFAAGLILNERLTSFQMLGAGIIITALILNATEKK
ncbi:MAG: DMT family transporter [Pseudobdellovibrionaceae bacterium]